MQLFHGTSTVILDEITRDGLHRPFLTARREIADYYAECAVDELGGEELILSVQVDPAQLRYDDAAMCELVLASEADRDAQWARAEAEHPEWVQGRYLAIPPSAYEYSLAAVSSVRADAVLTDFEVLD